MPVLGLLGACSPSAPPPTPDRFPVTAPLVGDTAIAKDYVAEIHSVQFVEVRSHIGGYIERILLAQQNALSANLELVEVQKRQRLALVDLYKALGGGWSDRRP